MYKRNWPRPLVAIELVLAVFVEGHIVTILPNYFEFLIRGFRGEDFFKVFFIHYKPRPLAAMFSTDQTRVSYFL